MIYVNPGATPVGNTCWTIIKPVQSTSSYWTCDISNPTDGKTIGSGSSRIFDDTNINQHYYSSGTFGSPLDDFTANRAYCGGLTSWWGEFVSASGGYHWAWTMTHLFEENYDSSHNYVSYTSSVADEGLGGSGSAYAPIPTIDIADPNAVSHIESLCYKSPWTPQGNYYFGIYSGTNVGSAKVTAVENALTYCFS